MNISSIPLGDCTCGMDDMLLFQVSLVELFELVEWNGFRIVVKIYVGGSGDDQ